MGNSTKILNVKCLNCLQVFQTYDSSKVFCGTKCEKEYRKVTFAMKVQNGTAYNKGMKLREKS